MQMTVTVTSSKPCWSGLVVLVVQEELGSGGSELAARVCRELQRAPRFMSSRRVHALPPSPSVWFLFTDDPRQQ